MTQLLARAAAGFTSPPPSGPRGPGDERATRSGWCYRSSQDSQDSQSSRRAEPALQVEHGDTRRVVKVARSRWTRFGLPALMVLLALVATAALAFPMISNWWASHRQHELAPQLDDPPLGGQVSNGTDADGRAIGRIIIPAIGLDMVMVQGDDESALASGPGHYPETPMPCTIGDAAVAGHRTTFLHPFYYLDRLKPGDVVEFETAAWSCSYTVSQQPFSVLPSDTEVVANTPAQYTLTLTTCTPSGSASHRLVVKAQMVPSSLRPSASSPGLTHARKNTRTRGSRAVPGSRS